ncbi:MAG: OmpA family protein [Methanosarcina sp.]
MRKDILTALLYLIIFFSASAQTDSYIITRAPFSSPKYDEFSPVFYKGGVVFCSNRDQGILSGYSTPDNKAFFKLYQADTTSGTQWQSSRVLNGKINSNLNNGPATFNRKGDTVYFSRNLIAEGSFRDVTGRGNKLGLFLAVLNNGEWTNVQDMRFNDNAWNVTTPYLAPDGLRLYFASDKPGGIGGSDLYYSEWRNGYWNNPVNLGRPVNTGGNEAYPFVNDAGDLFFSSDSLPGKGGKDIFFTHFTDTSWIKPVNLNAPINSSGNDFGFIADGTITKGYFSSDRSGMLDIYSFRTIKPQFFYCTPEQETSLCFSFPDDALIDIDPLSLQFSWEFGDGEKLSGYVVEHCYPKPGKYTISESISEKKTGRRVFLKTVADLQIIDTKLPQIVLNGPVLAGKEVNLNAAASLPGYEEISHFWDFGENSVVKGASATHVFSEGETRVRLLSNLRESSTGITRQVCVEKTVKVSVRPDVKQEKRNSNAIPVNLTHEINSPAITVEKIYSSAEETARKAVFAVQVYESAKPIEVNDQMFRSLSSRYVIRRIPSGKGFSYLIDEQIRFMSAYPSYRDAAENGFPNARIITYMPADTAEGELWNFKRTYGTSSDLYFMNNGTVISKKAMPLLDRLILLLKRNPALKIMVAAFTENTGSAYTNMQLSVKQAQSIVEYLVLNGISRSRLTATGYGGTRTIAPEYPESERIKNRRVDFIKVD